MKKFLLSILIVLTLAFPTFVSAGYVSDIIVTSPNGLWTDERAYASLSDAITAVGANTRTIIVASTETITNLTIPSNISIKFMRGSSIANSGTLTFQTTNIIADSTQIFTGSGAVNFADGTVVKTSWFSSFVESVTQTSNDTITLLITEPAQVTANASLGNNVILKSESPGNLITANAGFTLDNIRNIECPSFQLFAGSGDFDFLDGTFLKSSWFQSLPTAIAWIDSENVTIDVVEPITLGINTIIPKNVFLKVGHGATVDSDPGVTLTINGPFEGSDGCFGTSITVSFGNSSVKEFIPQWWGAKGDGVTDDVVAIQSAVTQTCSNSGTLRFPFGDYLISTEIDVPVNTHRWTIDGQMSNIIQDTNNTPIFKWSYTGATDANNNITVENFRFSWSTNQTYSHTLSQGLAFSTTVDCGWGLYNSVFRHLTIANGYSLFANTNATNILTVWGCLFENLQAEALTIGQLGKIKFSNPGGMPNNQFKNIYVRADVMTETNILDLSQMNQLKIDNYEVNVPNNNKILLLTSCRNSKIGRIRVESGTFSRNYGGIVDLSGCSGVAIESIEVQSMTISAANYAYVLRLSGSAVDKLTRIGVIDIRDTTVSPGVLYMLSNTSDGKVVLNDFNSYSITGSYGIVYLYDASVYNVHVALFDGDHMGGDVGDADITLYIKDPTNGTTPNVVLYNTAITADRAVTMPTSNKFPGARYRVIRTAAATGAFNVNVGTGPLKALGIGEWVEVLLQQNTGGTFTWFVVGAGSL